MLTLLDPAEYDRAQPLFAQLDDHLITQAVRTGSLPGRVLVDDAASPRCLLLQVGYRLYLVGDARQADFAAGLHSFLVDELYPQALAERQKDFVLAYAPAAWAPVIEASLAGKNPAAIQRHYYRRSVRAAEPPPPAPTGYSLRSVESVLLADEPLQNLAALEAEVLSESPSVTHFLLHRFGVCALAGDTLAAWCLSEHNTGDRCEVGIETLPAYQRRGLATWMARALTAEAAARGLRTVGWHCYATNAASVATALKAGFEKVCDYPAYYAWFDEIANLAVHGNVLFQSQRYTEALAWYERALQTGQAPLWAYVNAACAAARAGDAATAFACLDQAVAHGFTDVEQLRASASLQVLHARPEWPLLLARLAAPAAPDEAA